MKYAKLLTRNEMKSIMAGGNIHCSIDGNQFECESGSLTECTEACAAIAEANGTYCEGCAEFPEMSEN
ncbi:MAG: hypothetical protein R3220_08540 [Balneolaceae bacterium]|nr:hypothetical protein [Balneolaceae bacterium]